MCLMAEHSFSNETVYMKEGKSKPLLLNGEGQVDTVGLFCPHHLPLLQFPSKGDPEPAEDTKISSSTQGPSAVSFRS